MAISGTHILTNQSSTGATSYVTASGNPTTGFLEFLEVGNQVAAGTPNEPTVTGAGLTWVKVDTKVSTSVTTRRVTLFRAMGTASAGALTIDMAGQTQVRCGWSWSEFSGTDTSGTNGSGAIVQSAVGETTDAAPTTTLVVTLAAFSSVNNATYGCIRFGGDGAANALTAGSGFTQFGLSNGFASYQSQWRIDNDTTVDWTYNSTSFYNEGIAVEIKAFVSPASSNAQNNSGALNNISDLKALAFNNIIL